MFSTMASLGCGAVIGLVLVWRMGLMMAERGFPIPDEKRRIGCIDGLRGYLALLVAICHFTVWVRLLVYHIPWGTAPNLLQALGHGPVAIFFMITGMLFYPKIRGGLLAVNWADFLIKRVFRVVPSAYVSIAVILCLLWWKAGFTTNATVLHDTATNLGTWLTFRRTQAPLWGLDDAYLTNAGVLWTLWAEWNFYLFVLPLLGLLVEIARPVLPRHLTFLLLIPIGIATRMLFGPGFAGFLVHFMIGMVIFEGRAYPRVIDMFNRPVVGIVSVAMVVMAAIFLPPPISPTSVIFYAPFFACVAYGQNFSGVLSSRGALVLGEMSYSIYVIHGILLWLAMTLLGSVVAVHPIVVGVLLPLCLMVTVGVSAVLFLTVERPMIKASHRIARARMKPRAA